MWQLRPIGTKMASPLELGTLIISSFPRWFYQLLHRLRIKIFWGGKEPKKGGRKGSKWVLLLWASQVNWQLVLLLMSMLLVLMRGYHCCLARQVLQRTYTPLCATGAVNNKCLFDTALLDPCCIARTLFAAYKSCTLHTVMEFIRLEKVLTISVCLPYSWILCYALRLGTVASLHWCTASISFSISVLTTCVFQHLYSGTCRDVFQATVWGKRHTRENITSRQLKIHEWNRHMSTKHDTMAHQKVPVFSYTRAQYGTGDWTITLQLIEPIVPGECRKGNLTTDCSETSAKEQKNAVTCKWSGPERRGVTIRSHPPEQWLHSFAQSWCLSKTMR